MSRDSPVSALFSPEVQVAIRKYCDCAQALAYGLAFRFYLTYGELPRSADDPRWEIICNKYLK